MNVSSLHSSVVRRMIEALNTESVNDFMAVFTPDATVVDGPEYHGLEAIRAWTKRENFGVHMRIDVVREQNPEGTILEAQAASQGGYSGPATLTFTLHNDRISRLVID